jgi:ATP-dependent DNA helicase RecG
MRETNDGFEIARRDLEMRGPGEMLGTRQTGLQEFHIADLMRDQALLPRVQQTAELMHRQYPQYVDPIIRRWLGEAEHYGKV